MSTEAQPIPVRRRIRSRWFYAAACIVAVIVSYFAFWHYHLKRFQVVREGLLYRVAQPTEFGIRYLAYRYHAKTLLSVQLFDFQLKRGMYDPGEPDGALESAYAEKVGVHPVQWPMGEEQYWPFPTPWQFEEFFKLLDDPANRPVVVHCMGGRHRTGTLSALFRLEYDHWPVERTLAEMYDFNFGLPVPLQEANLRTYFPRPQPTAAEWTALAEALGPAVDAPRAANYEELVWRLRVQQMRPSVQAVLAQYVSANRPFGVPLAARLIDDPENALLKSVCQLAMKKLTASPSESEVFAAAALLADFGDDDQQRQLLATLKKGAREGQTSARFEAMVAGVGNRYTDNRLIFLQALLADERHYLRPGAERLRYCDGAVARMAVIANRMMVTPIEAIPRESDWDQARLAARAWCDQNPKRLQLSQLQPPAGQNRLRLARPPSTAEDLSRARF